METKFYVGQPVSVNGKNGNVTKIDPDSKEYHVWVQIHGLRHETSYTADGKKWSQDKDQILFPITPKQVLTEWQKEQLDIFSHRMYAHPKDRILFVENITSILSQPEPPKYQPKQGEAVLVRQSEAERWITRVATGNGWICYHSQTDGETNWNHCIPFDPSLVGKITD